MQKKAPQNENPPIKSAFAPPVVVASGGGPAAFEKSLGSIPEDSGMAYIIIQHLDPENEGPLSGLLQRITRVPVLVVTDDIKLEPDHIYVVPGNKMILATDGALKLFPADQYGGTPLSHTPLPPTTPIQNSSTGGGVP